MQKITLVLKMTREKMTYKKTTKNVKLNANGSSDEAKFE